MMNSESKTIQVKTETSLKESWFIWAFVTIISAHVVLLFARFGEPLLGAYKFRQTQTAISIYWMEKEGFKFFYDTPVLGSPWSIPFEFPLFQWLVALLSRIGIPIDPSARLVSFLFFLGCLYFIARLCDHFRIHSRLKWIFLFLLSISPLYIYWSATSMIESTALFFALGWLLFYLRCLNDFSIQNLLLCLAFGIIAALEKITTFPSFVFFAFLVTLSWGFEKLKTQKFNIVLALRLEFLKLLILPFLVIIPIFITLQWVHTSDIIKAQNMFGETITSARLSKWNYGTLRQRLNFETWIHIIGLRSLNHIFGYGWILLPLIAAACLRDIKGWCLAALSFLLFLSAPLIFWNLHVVHFYYQYSNALFLIFGAAVVFDRAMSIKFFGIGSLTFFTILSMWSFINIYGRLSLPSTIAQNQHILETTTWLKQNTSENSGVFVFGHDWSSHVHYYSERKGIAFKNSVTYDQLEDILESPSSYLGEMPLGALVVCANIVSGKFWVDKNQPKSRRDLLRKQVETMEHITTIKGCAIYQ